MHLTFKSNLTWHNPSCNHKLVPTSCFWSFPWPDHQSKDEGKFGDTPQKPGWSRRCQQPSTLRIRLRREYSTDDSHTCFLLPADGKENQDDLMVWSSVWRRKNYCTFFLGLPSMNTLTYSLMLCSSWTASDPPHHGKDNREEWSANIGV